MQYKNLGKNVRKGGGGTPLMDKIRKVVFDHLPKVRYRAVRAAKNKLASLKATCVAKKALDVV